MLLRIFLDYMVAVGASTWGHALTPAHVEKYVLLWSGLDAAQQEEGKKVMLKAWVSQDAATAAVQHLFFVLQRHGLFSFQQSL